jgi:transcription-repair coupling factor (superfamily II helicase)
MLIILLFCCDNCFIVYILDKFVNRKAKDMQQDFNALCGKKVTSVCDGYEPWVLALMASKERPLIYIAADGNALAQTASMLRLTHPEFTVLEFPAWDTVPYDRVSPNPNIMARRISVMSQLVLSEFKQPLIIVTSLGAVLQKLPPAKIFRNAQKKIKVGGTLRFDDFLHYIALNGYTRVEQVMEPG